PSIHSFGYVVLVADHYPGAGFWSPVGVPADD
ncbi:uncharacterized protein METZ01_LOCUS427065, partial [marine metagenome]